MPYAKMVKGRVAARRRHPSKKYVKPTKSFTEKVVKVINRRLDVKHLDAGYGATAIVLRNNTGPVAPTIVELAQSLIGTIGQGPGEYERLGNDIRVKSCIMRGTLYNTNATQRPFYIKMFLLKNKLVPAADTFNNLFEGTTGNPTNQLSDLTRRVNTDEYTYIASRTFKLGPSTATTNPNNDFKMSQFWRIDLTKHMKIVKYPIDGNGTVSQPASLFLVFVGAYADNTAITFGAYTGPAVSVSYEMTLDFTDA
ncbi:putative capsid protein [Lake Sarah-associated circular virus-50]|uniref:putative capsid protein n=1 Tax=Lake Sarah-associated circular virus-50 TaxID=1685780 RepID=UPI00077727A7|nr:putative capsid protein [Lake Sarah-associated circular virus-50]ALE29815.1 putative capsid protein [Lake Sarah-associated circular virus-50]ALE29818.1 putative capsid protein [Lake Sarah-associated circular virus-50]ALE29819.1 putative capsid protein [Lake Sarah-associated circular virus-50]ALE29822.1 putative capsid protein [Lake Sarah-associated circular virus-50]ALE29823.1 putative capsid protein [Lake Sarah-associated circular virus-50]